MRKECDNIRIILEPWLSIDQGIYAYIDEDGNSRHAISPGDPSCDIDIKYCPFCGRKLGE